MKKFLLVFLGLVLSFYAFSGIDPNAGTTAFQSSKIGIGARPSAMGDAFIGVANDYNAVQFNPAGGVLVPKTQISFQHTQWIEDVTLVSFSAIYPKFPAGVLGFGFVNLDYGDIQGTDDKGNETDSFTASDQLITLSYARKAQEGVLFGVNLKIITLTIAEVSASTFALDLGFMYNKIKLANRDLNLGLMVKDVSSSIRFEKEDDKLPLTVGIGAGWNAFEHQEHYILTALDIIKPMDNVLGVNIGLEYSFKKMLALRLGYKLGTYENGGFNCGLGFSYSFPEFSVGGDYSYSIMVEAFAPVHRFGLYFAF